MFLKLVSERKIEIMHSWKHGLSPGESDFASSSPFIVKSIFCCCNRSVLSRPGSLCFYHSKIREKKTPTRQARNETHTTHKLKQD